MSNKMQGLSVALPLQVSPTDGPYRWNKNFGYGTVEHINGLKKYGVTRHHRKKFKPIHNILINRARETQ